MILKHILIIIYKIHVTFGQNVEQLQLIVVSCLFQRGTLIGFDILDFVL